MRTGSIAYLGGMLLLLRLPELPDVRWCLLLLLLLPLALLAGRLRLLITFVCGFLLALWHANSILASTITPKFEGQDVKAVGVIGSLPARNGSGTRFNFIIEQLSANDRILPLTGKVRLSWYNPAPILHGGERWQLTLRLKHPHGLMNPGGYDYEAWLLQNRLQGSGYVRQADSNRRLGSATGRYRLLALRDDLAQRLAQSLKGQVYAGLITALAIGERQAITQSQWQVLTRTGTNHLVAISGLHIGLVAGLVFVLVRRLWAAIPWLVLRWPAPSAAAVGGIVAALAYAALAGFSIPTQRALIMVTVVLLAVLLQRHRRPSQVLAIALICVLTIDPLSPLSAGFWLSFAAVAIILFGMNNRLPALGRWSDWWWRWGRLHVLVSIGLFPLLLILFQRLPLMSPLANFIAVPWVSVLVVPPVLLGTLLLPLDTGLAQGCFHLASLSLSGLWPLLTAIARLDLAQWTQHVPLAWSVLPALMGSILLLLPRGVPGRWLGMVWLLPAVLVTSDGPAYQAIYFTLLDVGQGLAAVVQTQNHVLVYDTGPRFATGFDAGETVLVPFLRQRGVTRIDRLIIGHGDNDHIGGSDSLRRQVRIDRVDSSVPERLVWTRARACREHQHWRWDGVDFELLHPPPARAWQGNNTSCVLRVSNGSDSLLLSGDIEAVAEQRLVTTYGAELASEALVAPHHGSKTSSSEAFIKAVKPDYVLFPVGYRNRYHFPRPRILRRYIDHGSQVLRTDYDGAITLRMVAGQGIHVIRARGPGHRFWHHHPRYHWKR